MLRPLITTSRPRLGLVPTLARRAGVMALALLFVSGCDKGRRLQPPELAAAGAPVAVRVATVENRPRVAMEEVMGSVRTKLRANIEAKATGKIERMLVAPGQAVKTGDLLVELDARETKARLDQAVAVRDQAQQELRRATGLLKERAVSQQEFDLMQSRARVAEATVAEWETLLDYARIVAPFSGLVTRKLADVGDLAVPGKALLELEDPSSLRLEADVPEALIDRVQLGDKFSIRIASLTNTLEGVSSEIAPAADPGSRTFLVKFDLPSIGGFRAGQFGRVLIPVASGAALRVPAGAVVQRGQMELVFVMAEGHAQLRLVKTGKHVDGEVEVVAGVSANERVVSEGAENLMDGQPLAVK